MDNRKLKELILEQAELVELYLNRTISPTTVLTTYLGLRVNHPGKIDD